ncbi:LrgB-like family-domain-containing protein [Phakopsora pachyrhizi]|uniref:LrgB-like family-domain-containing protein n=1 Tax=Phakopsora pachyrhizi TaxID=170000 RepID=A0AAV0AK45_PHAPC|nr:LrgB-like family-domain-containing protein [Phakopsora pachyrhizi]
MGSLSTFRKAIPIFYKNYRHTIFTHYLLAPLGVIVLLALAFFTDMVIDLLPVTFPASVICLILLFAFLVLFHKISPLFVYHYAYQLLNPAADFLLACMGLFFTSSFILIPRRDPMPAKEILLIAALFLPPFFVSWFGTVAICKLLAYIWPYNEIEGVEEEDNANVLNETECGSVRSLNQGHSHPHHKPPQENANTEPRIEGMGVEELETALTQEEREKRLVQANVTLDQNETMCDSQPSPGTDREYDLEKANLSEKGNFMKRTFSKLKKSVGNDKHIDPLASPEEILAKKLENWFDPLLYSILLLVGIPIFYSPNGVTRSLPLFTGVVSLAWMFSRRAVPQPWQKVLHPILVTSIITVFAVWMFGAIKGLTLNEVLQRYSTGANYLVLFRRSRGWDGRSPSAGDLMSSLLTAGIVALAFPLFRYRWDLYNNFFRLLIIAIPNAAISLLLWPLVARQMGIQGERAITFAGRFMSTPFGIQLLVATGGDTSLVVVLICITGILAVLLRDTLFKLTRTRTTPGSSEYFTIGCTIGVIAAAIGTSSLMANHSRAAATSTVMFSLYGLILLGLVAVPSIAEFVGDLAGL